MTEIELELTYLAKVIPKEVKNSVPIEMIDIYVPATARHPNLRIRKKDNQYEITKKIPVSGADSSRQYEHTIPLNKEEYESLIKCSGRIIKKDRYKIELNGYSTEVDIFKDKLAGLVVIDFEFANESDKNSFIAPKECLLDITQDEWIAGGILAGKSYDDIGLMLNNAGYKKLYIKS